jgi:hypothetical protein
MQGFDALGRLALGEAGKAQAVQPTASNQFDWFATVISQYANSDILVGLIENMADYLNANADMELFFNLIWNIDTAQGYGLDIWGKIIGVQRVIQVSATDFFGYVEQTEAEGFDINPFYSGDLLTNNFALSDTAFRRLLFAKALANISDSSIPSINQILINLFPGHGNVYATDGLDMTMTYTFSTPLSAIERSVVEQSGILPKPVGVTLTIVD